MKIFMGLKEGTLESLVESGADTSTIASSVFPHMLQALDFLDWKGIIHQDVNQKIFYISPSRVANFSSSLGILDSATVLLTPRHKLAAQAIWRLRCFGEVVKRPN